jgi:hypothetical protein
MKIDLHKLVLLLLPPLLRSKTFSQFIRSQLLQVQRTCDEFCLFLHDAKYRANADSSVISLEHHIEREFDVPAKITELSGRPTDFLVTVDGNIDESRLRSLIDSYKLFGKSYIFKVSGVEYTSEWMEHVCENMSIEYVSEWIEYVCESKEVVYIDYSIDTNPFTYSIHVSASKSVHSDVRFRISLIYYYHGELQEGSEDGVILAGNSHAATLYVSRPVGVGAPTFVSLNLQDTEDEKYYYRK